MTFGDIYKCTYKGQERYWMADYVEYVGEYVNVGFLSNDKDYVMVDKYKIGYKPEDMVRFPELENPTYIERVPTLAYYNYQKEFGLKRKFSPEG